MYRQGEVQSRYLAKFVNNLPGLKDLTLRRKKFHDCFYTELASGTGCVEETGNSVCKLLIDHWFCNNILQHDLTVEKLFPKLEELFFATLQSVSSSIIGSLAHSSLKKLSLASNGPIDDDDGYPHELIRDEKQHPSLVGDRRSLEQEFLNSFPGLTDLAFKDLVIGNNRCGAILLSLKQHQHLKYIRVIHCYTDEEIDPIASAINMEKRMNVELQHAKGQKCLRCYQMSSGLADALYHRTSVQELILQMTQFDDAWFASMNGRTVDSKIKKLTLERLYLKRNDPSASRDLATFLCLQPCLTDLKISFRFDEYGDVLVWLHDEFYHEIARLASSSKIKKLTFEGLDLGSNDPSSSRDLATFLCLQPGLTDLKISSYDEHGCVLPVWLHDGFYHEIARLASSSKIQKLTLGGLNLERNDPSSSRDLATFLCLQPGLTDLNISSYDEYGVWLHDEFYHEIARLASSSKNPFFKNNVTWKTWYNEHRKEYDPQYALHPWQTTNSAGGSPTESSESESLESESSESESESVESVESLLQEHSSQQCHAQPETFVQSHQFQLQEQQVAQQRQYSSRLSESDTLSDTPQSVTSPVQGSVNVSLYQKQTPQEVAQTVSQPSCQGFASFPPEVPIESEPLAQSYPLQQSVPQPGTEHKQEHHRSQAAFLPSHRSQELLTWSSSPELSTTHFMYQGYAQSAPRILQAPLRKSSQSPQLNTQHHIPSPQFPSRRQLPPLQGEWLHATQNRGNEGLSSFHPPQGWYYSDVFPNLEPTCTQSSQPWSTQAPSQTAAYNQLAQMPALQRSVPDQPPIQQYQLQSPGTQSYQLTPSTSYCPQQLHELRRQSHFSQHAQGTRSPQLINTDQTSMIQNQHQTALSAGTFSSRETCHYQQHQPRQQIQRHFSQHPVQTPVSPSSSKSSQASGVPQQPYTQVINANQAMINPNQHQTATFAATRQSPETNHYYQHRQSQQLHRHFSHRPVQVPSLPSSKTSLQASGSPLQPYAQVINTHQAGIILNQHRAATWAGTLPSHAEIYRYQEHQQGQPRHVSQHPVQKPVTPISYAHLQAEGGPQQPNTHLNPRHMRYHPYPRYQHPN